MRIDKQDGHIALVLQFTPMIMDINWHLGISFRRRFAKECADMLSGPINESSILCASTI